MFYLFLVQAPAEAVRKKVVKRLQSIADRLVLVSIFPSHSTLRASPPAMVALATST